MSAEAPGQGSRRPPLFTPARITFAIVFALLALPLGLVVHAGAGFGLVYGGYLVFLLATAAVLRGLRRDASRWADRRVARRALVGTMAATCAGLIATGGAPPLLVLLLILNVALGHATQRVATAPDRSVDERQEQLRNRAHRLAYLLLAPVIGLALAATGIVPPAARPRVEDTILGFGAWVVLAELLFVLPAMAIAWLEPDRLALERRPAPQRARGLVGLAMVVVAVAFPFATALGVAVVPVQTTRWVSPPISGMEAASPARTCRELMASAQVGLFTQANLPVNAIACWDGRTATSDWGTNQSDCAIRTSFLTTVTTERCVRTVTPEGTLHFEYGAAVRPMLLPFVVRHVALELVVDRNGNVERLP